MRTRHSLPVSYGVIALLAVALLLPSALRPPPDEANASAEFSADAPPDEDPDVIIQTLEQARSQTAGGLKEQIPPDTTTTTQTPPPPELVQTKAQCWGDPPRQTESHYSAPCLPIFVGDNGGSTYAGVTGDEIRIAFASCGHNLTFEWHGPGQAEKTQGGQTGAWWAYRQYFNDHFETYNRYIQFYGAEPDCDSPETRRASIVALDDQYDFFAVLTDSTEVAEVMAGRKKVVFFQFEAEQEFYDRHHPYVWSFIPTGERLADHTAEYLCKRVIGRNAVHAGDPLLQQERRKLGFFLQDRESLTGLSGWRTIQQKIKDRCGEEVLVFSGSPFDPNVLGQMFAQFRVEGVTTVALRTDVITPSVILKAASGQSYYPEWFITPTTDLDHPVQPKLFGYDKQQWANAFGLGQSEPNKPSLEYDWGKAYRYSFPEDQTAPSIGGPPFRSLLQLINGVHLAGPDLNPHTLAESLYSMGKRFWDNGDVGGGFTPTDHTYMEDLLEIWWDNEARDYHDSVAGASEQPGSYVHVHCGRRYRLGAHLDAELEVFDRSVSCETYG